MGSDKPQAQFLIVDLIDCSMMLISIVIIITVIFNYGSK